MAQESRAHIAQRCRPERNVTTICARFETRDSHTCVLVATAPSVSILDSDCPTEIFIGTVDGRNPAPLRTIGHMQAPLHPPNLTLKFCSEGVSDRILSDLLYQVATTALANIKCRGVQGDVANHTSKMVQDFVHQPTEILHCKTDGSREHCLVSERERERIAACMYVCV